MEKRKSYEYTIAFVLLAVCLMDLVFMLLRVVADYHITVPLGYIKFFLIVYILIFESVNSQKLISTVNLLLLVLAFFGFLFRIMHWPFGAGIFFGAIFLVIFLLFMDVIKSGRNKNRLLILSFLTIHYVIMLTGVARIPVWVSSVIIEIPIMGVIGTLLLVWLKQEKENTDNTTGS